MLFVKAAELEKDVAPSDPLLKKSMIDLGGDFKIFAGEEKRLFLALFRPMFKKGEPLPIPNLGIISVEFGGRLKTGKGVEVAVEESHFPLREVAECQLFFLLVGQQVGLNRLSWKRGGGDRFSREEPGKNPSEGGGL